GAVLATALTSSASAATRCVRPDGRGGCSPTITQAVASAAPYDTINVYPGTYHESVTINKPLYLLGANRSNTTIDASGLSYGINIDGFTQAGISDVTVSGFTVTGANFEGVLISNARDVILRDNNVTENDRALASPACPGLPPPDSQ